MTDLSRRRFLQASALAAAGLSTRSALAMGEPPVQAARLIVPGLEDPRPGALEFLMGEVQANSSVITAPEVASLDAGSAAIFDHPLLVLAGDRGFEPLSAEALSNLRLFVREGGFLFVDDTTGVPDSDFDRSVRRDLGRLLPGSELSRIGRDHAVYRSYFLMRSVSGRVLVHPYLEGLWVGDITPVLYSTNDLLGALQRRPDGRWSHEVVPGRGDQRLQARRLAMNLVLFALTSNYKRDAVHVRTLIERMRRQGGYGD